MCRRVDIRVADVSVIDPVTPAYCRAAAQADGVAAARRDRDKEVTNGQYAPSTYECVLMSHE